MERRDFVKLSSIIPFIPYLFPIRDEQIKLVKGISWGNHYKDPVMMSEIEGVERFLSKKILEFYNNIIYNTVFEYEKISLEDIANGGIGYRYHLVRFMGMAIVHEVGENPLISDLKRFCNLINLAAEKELIGKAVLCPVVCMRLAPLDSEEKVIVHPSKFKNAKKDRSMFLFFPVGLKNDWHKEEYNKVVGKRVFIDEAQLPLTYEKMSIS